MVILYVTYPLILNQTLKTFDCVNLEENETKRVLSYSPTIQCWTTSHWKWAVVNASIGVGFWGIAMHTLIYSALRKNRERIASLIDAKAQEMMAESSQVDDGDQSPAKPTRRKTREKSIIEHISEKSSTAEMLAFFWAGHHPTLYYWQMIVILRRTSVVLFTAFTSYFSLNWQTILLLALFFFFARVHYEAWPYSKPGLNVLEMASLLVLYSTAAGGLLLLSVVTWAGQLALAIVIIVLNAAFTLIALAFMLEAFNVQKVADLSVFKRVREAAISMDTEKRIRESTERMDSLRTLTKLETLKGSGNVGDRTRMGSSSYRMRESRLAGAERSEPRNQLVLRGVREVQELEMPVSTVRRVLGPQEFDALLSSGRKQVRFEFDAREGKDAQQATKFEISPVKSSHNDE
jgi:hypothetical protein